MHSVSICCLQCAEVICWTGSHCMLAAGGSEKQAEAKYVVCFTRCILQEQVSNQHKEIDEAETAADVARELVEAEEQKLQVAEQQLQGAHARQQRANQAVTEPLTGSVPMVGGRVFPNTP